MLVLGVLALALPAALLPPGAHAALETVQFASADGNTMLTGYVFVPEIGGRHAAIVMLHGRSGPYSSRARRYDAAGLSARHFMWGEFWASHGYVALLVDSFGPRGFARGFPAHSYKDRPAGVSDQTVRPLDAYGALEYLRRRVDVVPERIGVHGWSNGAMAVLSAMDSNTKAIAEPRQNGFRAALAMYPSCRTQEKQAGYMPYAPLLVLSAGDDDEVSPHICRRFADAARSRGAPLELVVYDGAQHAFDDPGAIKQQREANRAALMDSRKRAEDFFGMQLAP